MLEQKQPDHEAGRRGGSALVAEQRCDLAVDPLPIDLAGKLHQLVLEVDDLIEPRPEQIARTRRLMLLRPHRSPSDAAPNHCSSQKGIPKNEIASFQAQQPQKLAISNQLANQKSTRDQPFRHSSRPTKD